MIITTKQIEKWLVHVASLMPGHGMTITCASPTDADRLKYRVLNYLSREKARQAKEYQTDLARAIAAGTVLDPDDLEPPETIFEQAGVRAFTPKDAPHCVRIERPDEDEIVGFVFDDNPEEGDDDDNGLS